MTDPMRVAGTVVNSAAQMLSSGDVNLDTMPQLILRIINEEMWRQRAIPQRRWELSREFASFEEFVTAEPLDGLHITIQTLKDLCRRDIRAQEAIDRVCEKTPGAHHPHHNIMRSNQGTSQSYALRRLRRERPDLLERVLAGDLTPNTAAVQAGFRPRTFTVRADSAESAERAIRSHMDPEQIRLLAELLTEQEK